MRGYGRAAITAARLLSTRTVVEPRDAWNIAVEAEFPHSVALREKACPRASFLGLCQSGKLRSVPAGKYTKSLANTSYALKAIKMLGEDSSLSETPEKLWQAVIGNEEKRHNSQMDVVTALWINQLISL